ncbi:MAG TPA: alpha/beta fold hydrolase [Ramlibacter sp.]|nr:alpha/beta fold hydrolase [Ramlibacter sp.]
MSSAEGLEVGFAEVEGSRWRVAWRPPQPGDGRPPLVLCNGIGVNWELLLPLVRALGSRPLVAFDVPGTGDSPALAEPYRMSGLASQVIALLDRLDVHRFDALGVSWGGALAQQLALQAGARCRRLVLAATSTGWASFPGELSALVQLADRRRLADPRHAGRVLPQVYGGQVRREPALLREYLRQVKPPTQRGYTHQTLALAGWTSVWWLPCLAQPTLILAGRDDPLVPLANAHVMQRLLRRAELEIVEDGHLFLHTRAAEVGPRIARFLDGHRP